MMMNDVDVNDSVENEKKKVKKKKPLRRPQVVVKIEPWIKSVNSYLRSLTINGYERYRDRYKDD